MKRYLYIIASLAIAFVSCTEMKEPNENPVEEGPKAEVYASIVMEPGIATKTYITPIHEVNQDQEYPVLWSDGDEIALISDKVSTFTIDSEVETVDSKTYGPGHTDAKFSGSAASLSGKFPGTKGYPAAYPAEGAFATLPESNQFYVGSKLPNKQSFVNGSFADNVYPMAAVSNDGTEYLFQNLCGLIQINILTDESSSKTERIKSIYLYGNNGEKVAGSIGMCFNATTCEPVQSTGDEHPEYNGIKIDTEAGESYEKLIIDFGANPLELSKTDTTTINFAIIPQTFVNGFTVEVVDANMGSSYYRSQDNITVKRSMIKEITPIIDYRAPEPIEIANSYIYEEPGTYLMPAFAMGNRLDVKIDVEKHPNLNADLLWTDIVVPGTGGPGPATKIDAITDLQYIRMDDGNNLIQFKVNKDPATGEAYRGNAAIALYDEDTKEILWSWHLWLTEYHDVVTGGSCADGSYNFSYTVAGETINHTFVGDASSGKLIILDRNLGATEANPDDCNGDIWKTYGFYYQDGRKDPFIGGHYNGSFDPNTTTENYKGEEIYSKWRDDETTPFSMVNDDVYGTCRTWWNTELAPKGWNWKNGFINVTQSIQNPLCFSCGCGTGDAGNPQWTLYTDPDNKSWLNNDTPATKGKQPATGGTHGRTGLSDAGHEAYWNRTKTIMDPCPAGYTVLGERTGVMLSTSEVNNQVWSLGADGPALGVTTSFSYNGTTYSTWWPAAGVRSRKGLLADVGHYGPYFYYDHISATHGGHGMFFEIYTDKGTLKGHWLDKAKPTVAKGGVITGHATPIRCVRAKQFTDLTKYPLK